MLTEMEEGARRTAYCCLVQEPIKGLHRVTHMEIPITLLVSLSCLKTQIQGELTEKMCQQHLALQELCLVLTLSKAPVISADSDPPFPTKSHQVSRFLPVNVLLATFMDESRHGESQ